MSSERRICSVDFELVRSTWSLEGLPDHSYGIRASARDNLRSSMATTMEGRRAVSLGRASRGPRSLTAPPPSPSSHITKWGRGATAGQTYPHIHSREQKKKNQKEKDYYGVDSGSENPCSESYKVAGSNPAPATIDNTRLTQCVGLFLCPKSIALIDFAQRCATFCAN